MGERNAEHLQKSLDEIMLRTSSADHRACWRKAQAFFFLCVSKKGATQIAPKWRAKLWCVDSSDMSMHLCLGPFGLLSQKYHRLGDRETTEMCFSHFRRPRNPDRGAGRFGVWRGPTSLFTDGRVLTVTSRDRSVRGLSEVSFIKALIPSMRAPPL